MAEKDASEKILESYNDVFSDISVQTPHGIDISMSYGLNYLRLCYFSFQR